MIDNPQDMIENRPFDANSHTFPNYDMILSHILPHCTLDDCGAAIYVRGRLGEGNGLPAPSGPGNGGWSEKETTMMIASLKRFLRARRTYRSVLQELSGYTDRELHDIGI